MKAKKFDEKFDSGENITSDLDLTKANRFSPKKGTVTEELPKGLILLAILIGLPSLLSLIGSLFQFDNYMISGGKIFSGTPYRIFSLLIDVTNIIIAMGLLKLKLRSYYIFATLTIFYLINSLVNILFTRYETLIEAGWGITENRMSSFYILQGLVILISLLMFLWFRKYRGILQ